MRNQWILGVKRRGSDLFDLSGMSAIIPPDGKYYADPFVIERDGRTWIFIEDYDYKKGVISVMELWDDMSYSDPVKVIEEDFHMSFPSLYEEAGKLYMVPEVGQARTMVVYECVEFPYKWRYLKRLVNECDVSDVAVWQDEKYCWMFTTMQPDLRTHLVILRTDGSILDVPYVVAKDILPHARPAGAVFEHEGKTYLPLQKSEKLYGEGVYLLDIILGDLEFDYKYAHEFEIWAPGLIGMHTFNFSENWVVVDGKRKING